MDMHKPAPRFSAADYFLWSSIIVTIAAIYLTLPLVPIVRKALAEKYGQDVYNWIFVVFGTAGLALLVNICISQRGLSLVLRLAALACIAVFCWQYLGRMTYAVERVHLLEYGVLGALLAAAFRRRTSGWVSMALALSAAFIAGLGDEALQKLMPDRVAEIRDALTDLTSAGLGIGTLAAGSPAFPLSGRATRRDLRWAVAAAAITTLAASLFLCRVHGFGHAIETHTCRIFSSFTQEQLAAINAGPLPAGRAGRIYGNEALRHLHQRDFYFTNDFLIKGGGFYRCYSKSLAENRVLETWYPRFLQEHAGERSGALLQPFDKKLAAQCGMLPVVWPDSLRGWVEKASGNGLNSFFTSRVKETIIVSYSVRTLLLCTAGILALLGFAWLRLRDSGVRH